MTAKLKALFESEKGKKIYDSSLELIRELSIDGHIKEGVLVGFSGGADSVMLLSVLKKYSEDFANFKILAVHINHMIRGEEAKRDEEFSREFSAALGIEFISQSHDVPALAKELSRGIEETARDVRYTAFQKIIQGRNDVKTIAVAHNSTDNLETVIFNLTRGAGTRGMSGIQPLRDNVVRPLLYSAKSDIVSALNEAGIPFVTDSTNSELDYSRNYIRSEIIPRLHTLSEKPEKMTVRMSKNLRSDDDFISGVASEFLKGFDAKIPQTELANLHFAVFVRVISHLARSIEHTHLSKIYELLKTPKNKFTVSLPGNIVFAADGKFCEILPNVKRGNTDFYRKLTMGINEIPEINAEIILSNEKIDNNSVKIYKTAIQQVICSDIIVGELFVRPKRDGDSYVYGKMTRKLKKLFNDRGVLPSERGKIPLICDSSGILWLPGFSVRDGEKKNSDKMLYILVGYKE